MRCDQLEHAIRTACQIMGKPELFAFAIFPLTPYLGRPPRRGGGNSRHPS